MRAPASNPFGGKYNLPGPWHVHILCALFRGNGKNFMRRPKGIKTRKSFAKRFKITATGKVLRSRAGKRHLLQGKSAKRRRSMRGGGHLVHKTDMKRVLESMPFSHRG
jgi:large subunit ribosomal protein L35